MVGLVLCLDVLENEQCLVKGGRFNHHFLETPLESSVLLYDLPEFVQRSGSDALYVASGKCGLEHVGCIQAA